MAARKDIAVSHHLGKRFSQLLVIGPSTKRGTKWLDLCRCDCGTEKLVSRSDLGSGNTKSCGCRASVVTSERNTKHGMYGTPTYQSWWAMKQRCTYPNHIEYPRYGAAGITLCEQWMEFSNFLADMGERPAGRYSLDRIDNSRGYEPGNVRWATRVEQANNCSSNRCLTAFGKTMTVAQWSREVGIGPLVIAKRLGRGWSVERSLSEPLRLRTTQ